MRIGTVSISPDPLAEPAPSFDVLYQRVGMNTGNLMFTRAMFHLFDAQVKQIGFAFDPDRVNREFDAVVIPAANWLNPSRVLAPLTERLRKLKVPITLLGIGLQATRRADPVRVSAAAMDLVRHVAAVSPWISVRGEFTRDWLRREGITNVVTTGCPSLYMNAFSPGGRDAGGPVVIQSTRFYLTRRFLWRPGLNRRLFALAGALDAPMVFQSEAEEMELLTCGRSARLSGSRGRMLARLYGFRSVDKAAAYMTRRGKVFYDLEAWSGFQKSAAGLVGSRLHGSILSLNSGVPALLLTHDSRTAEMAEFAGIPVAPADLVARATTERDLRLRLDDVDMSAWADRRRINQTVFAHFLSDSGLPLRREAMFD